MLLAHALSDWFGQAGTLALSAVSGITDVDAITLALGRQSTHSLDAYTAAMGIIIAASVNTLVKMGMVISIGDRGLWVRVAPAMVLSVVAGAVTLLILH
jgi:uncharacterized membrane protein (DUF4010 family)